MKNTYIQKTNAPIVKIDDLYYAYISTVFGIVDGYNKGIYLYLNEAMLNYENLEELLKSLAEDELEEFYSKVLEIEDDIIVGLPDSVDETSDILTIDNYEVIDSKDYEYYAKLNNMKNEYSLSEENVNDTRGTFAKLILYYAFIEDQSIKTEIYKRVLNFYSNGMNDDTLTNLNLVMSSSAYMYNDTSSMKSCGCTANSISQDSLSTMSCSQGYVNALDMYMKQMLSDIDFYCAFMFLDTDEPNEELIDYLIDLLKALLSLEYPMNFNPQSAGHCKCEPIVTTNKAAYTAIENYIKVLEWIKNCEIEENVNKIKIYGEKFAEIYPYLSF